MSGELLLVNPRKRKSKAKRAAPRRKAASRRRRAAPVVVMSNPAPRRRHSRLSAVRSKIRRAGRKYRRNPIPKLSLNAITGMAKNAAMGAAGALAVDVAFGYAKGFLPMSMQSPVNIDGSVNPMYFAAKGGIAVLAGVLGSKLTKHAGEMAAGALTVSVYEVMRSFVPASVSLGYASPARVMRGQAPASPRLNGVGKFVSGYRPPVGQKYSGVGKYVS